jgi:DNA primase
MTRVWTAGRNLPRQGPPPDGPDRARHEPQRRARVLQAAGAPAGSDEPRPLHDVVRAGERNKRIYIDYLRNGRGTTAVAAYSPRAREGFPVAEPVTWAQVERGIRLDAFKIEHPFKAGQRKR